MSKGPQLCCGSCTGPLGLTPALLTQSLGWFTPSLASHGLNPTLSRSCPALTPPQGTGHHHPSSGATQLLLGSSSTSITAEGPCRQISQKPAQTLPPQPLSFQGCSALQDRPPDTRRSPLGVWLRPMEETDSLPARAGIRFGPETPQKYRNLQERQPDQPVPGWDRTSLPAHRRRSNTQRCHLAALLLR